jgi:FixJ family two-component response regulator
VRQDVPASPRENLADEWIAVIDDDDSVRHSLARILRSRGIRVETFASAEDFLSRDDASEPCCLVLDVQLGGLSGFDLCDVMAARGDRAPPVIFMTAHDDIASTQLAFRANSFGYLRKPFYAEALLALVQPHLTFMRSEQAVR